MRPKSQNFVFGYPSNRKNVTNVVNSVDSVELGKGMKIPYFYKGVCAARKEESFVLSDCKGING